jgi:signal transduction histidine kinase
VDCTQVWQVLHNLVTNSLEAAGDNGRVWVKVQDAGDRVMLSVEDDGPGIDEQLIQNVFDPLVTAKPGGTGLGLAIVKMYVEANGGVIEVGKSKFGGARFIVSFPLESKKSKQAPSAN